MAARACEGLVAKTGERCTRDARSMSRYCGHCDPVVREQKSLRAAKQWRGARLMRGVEEASALIVSHRMNWCRARIMHALAGADEQGALEQVLDELLGDDGPAADGGSTIKAGIRGALARWRAPG